MSPVTVSRVDFALRAVGLGIVSVAIWPILFSVPGSWKRAQFPALVNCTAPVAPATFASIKARRVGAPVGR